MNGTITIVVSAGGKSIQSAFTRSAAGGLPAQDLALAAAQGTGTLSTRTDDNDGTLTLQSGHGITDAQVIDIYWVDGNGNRQCAYGATVGTVAGTSVPFTGAAGTALPTQDTAITCDVVQELDVDFDGDKLELLDCQIKTAYGHVLFEDSVPAVLDRAVLLANEPYLYWTHADCMPSNLLTGNPVNKIKVSNGDYSNAGTFELCGLYNSDT